MTAFEKYSCEFTYQFTDKQAICFDFSIFEKRLAKVLFMFTNSLKL